MNLILATLIGYLLFMFLVAWFFSRNSSLESYFLNSQSTGVLIMTISIVATTVGAGATVAMMSELYNTGISYGIALPSAMIFAAVLLGVVGKNIRIIGQKFKTYTLVDFFEKRFDNKNKNLMFVLQIIMLVLWLSTHAVALATLVSAITQINYIYVLLISASITVAYTAIGGLKIDFITDFIQFWIILVVFIITAILSYIKVGGITNMITLIPKSHLNIFEFGGVTWFVGAILFGGLFTLGNTERWQALMASKNPEVARKSYYLAIPILVIFCAIILFLGLTSKALLIGINPDYAIFELMKLILPDFLVGLGFASILAIIMSSQDSLLVGGSTIIYRQFFLDTNSMSHARIITSIFGLFGFAIAFFIPKLVALSLLTTYIAVIIAIAVLFALYRPTLSSNVVFYGLIISIILLVISYPIIGPNSFIFPVISSLLIYSFGDNFINHSKFQTSK